MDLLSAGVSVVGGLLGNNSAKKEAARSRAYDEKVRKNSHQWEVEDLEKAGLNKVLSAGHGSGGASTPVANVGNPLKDVQSDASASSARKLQQTQTRIAQSEERIQKAKEKALLKPGEVVGRKNKLPDGTTELQVIQKPSLLEQGLINERKLQLQQINSLSANSAAAYEQADYTRFLKIGQQYSNVGLKSTADFYKDIGKAGKYGEGASKAIRLGTEIYKATK